MHARKPYLAGQGVLASACLGRGGDICTASEQGSAGGHAGTMWCDYEGELEAQRANSASDKQVRAVQGCSKGTGGQAGFCFCFRRALQELNNEANGLGEPPCLGCALRATRPGQETCLSLHSVQQRCYARCGYNNVGQG